MSQKKYRFDPLNFEQLDENQMLANSNSFYELMKRRRTVREYSDRTVPREIIENAIHTAGTAPSGANMQPWHFAVVSNPAIKKEIRIAAEAEEKELYSHRASREWLEALAPLGTDEHKPFLETAPYLDACLVVAAQHQTHSCRMYVVVNQPRRTGAAAFHQLDVDAVRHPAIDYLPAFRDRTGRLVRHDGHITARRQFGETIEVFLRQRLFEHLDVEVRGLS